MVQPIVRSVIAILTSLICTAAVAQQATDDDTQALRDQTRQLMEQQDYAQALKITRAAAANGNVEALAILGQMYMSGSQGVPQDYARARRYFRQAAAKGNASGLFNLGLMYWQGLGVAKRQEKALTYFEAARQAGHMKAGRYIGLYHEQHGNDALAVEDYRQAAQAGDITSQYYLGRAYELGKGIPRDYAQAMAWYTQSATRGDSVASDGMVGLASLYEHGEGVPTDLTHAKALYEQAAQLGNANAQAALKRLAAQTP